MKAHVFDPLSFAAGLVFATLGLIGAAGLLDDPDSLRIAWPAVLVLFGVLLVGSTLHREGGHDVMFEDQPVELPEDE